ncbi:MAG: phosphoglycerate dehydrogenase [Bacillota bacterium]|jgi:D-3-phosphoglycerate dehydrogenase
MKKVLICDAISGRGTAVLKEAGLIVDEKIKLSEEAIVDIIEDYEAVMVRSATKITRPIIEAGKNLKVIGRAGVGVDNIDVQAATARGIVVVNSPEGNTIAAAEHTIAMMLALARNIPPAHGLLVNGVWEKKKFMGVEVRGKTLGVIGLGKIGGEVARRGRGLDMDVIGYDPVVSPERAKKLGVRLVGFDELISQADFITVHVPKTKETIGMIGARQFDMMKPGARVINVARGGIIDEGQLVAAVKERKIGGAAIDVFVKEPVTESPLFGVDGIIVTPHLGASTEEAQENVAVDVAQEIVRALSGETVRNAVNIPSIKKEHMDLMGPYLCLVEKLGRMLAQMADDNIKSVNINYNGPFAAYDCSPLTNTLLKGLLRPSMQESVNYVNAPLMAQAQGIKVSECRSVELEDYASLVSVVLKTEKSDHSLAGTLFQNKEARIVRIDGYTVDANPQGHMLVIPHVDKPRIIGRVGTLIGENDINIAGMIVGRKVLGGRAIALLQVDAEVPKEILEEIGKIDGVIDVKYVYL